MIYVTVQPVRRRAWLYSIVVVVLAHTLPYLSSILVVGGSSQGPAQKVTGQSLFSMMLFAVAASARSPTSMQPARETLSGKFLSQKEVVRQLRVLGPLGAKHSHHFDLQVSGFLDFSELASSRQTSPHTLMPPVVCIIFPSLSNSFLVALRRLSLGSQRCPRCLTVNQGQLHTSQCFRTSFDEFHSRCLRLVHSSEG